MHLCIWTSGGPTAQILKLQFGPKIWCDLHHDLCHDLSHDDLSAIWATMNAPIVGLLTQTPSHNNPHCSESSTLADSSVFLTTEADEEGVYNGKLTWTIISNMSTLIPGDLAHIQS